MVPNNSSGAVVQARAVFCPNCGATVQLRGFAHTLNVTCSRCLSVLDPNTPTVQLLQKVQIQQRITPIIPMGSRGKFEGVEFEAIGFQERCIVVDGVSYCWQEYLLFHPYKGFRYLTVYMGHWNYIRPKQSVPAISYRSATMEGRTYKHFQSAQARTTYVAGEFPWQVRVGDSVHVNDYIAPPYILSSETTADEVNWSVGEYVEGKQVFEAFGLKEAAPPSHGVYANQPNPRTTGTIWNLYLLFTIIALCVSMYSCVAKHEREVFKQTYEFVPASNAEPSFVTPVFELPGWRKAKTEVEISSTLSNNWVAFAIALINQETGEAFDFGKDLSYYSGVDGGESWSEGSTTTTVKIPSVPPGRYYLRIEPDRDQQPDDTPEKMLQPIHYSIIVRHDVPSTGLGFLVLLLLVIPPFWHQIRKWIFEQQRWAESDYAAVSSGDDSSDSSSSED